MKVMQSPVDYASNYLKEKAERDHVQTEKEKRDTEFFTELRTRREKEMAELREKRRVEQEAFRKETRPLRPLPSLPPALIKNEPHDPSAPMLVNPNPELRERERRLSIADDKGIFGLGLLGLIRRRRGL